MNKLEQRPKKNWRQRLIFKISTLIVVTVSGLFGLSLMSKAPVNLGIRNGKLAPCPDSQNCVSTESTDESQMMDSISYSGSKTEALEKLESVLAGIPRAEQVEKNASYLRYEVTSLIFRFVDDVEFMFPDNEKVIHFRSASRVGYSDLGANRKRMQRIVQEMQLADQD